MAEGNPARTAGRRTPRAVLISAFLEEMETWTRAQGEALAVVEQQMSGWMKRRVEAADAVSRSLQKMSACQNPLDFIQIQQDWLSGAFERAAADVRALADDPKALAAKMDAGLEVAVGSRDQGAWQTRRVNRKGPGSRSNVRPSHKAAVSPGLSRAPGCHADNLSKIECRHVAKRRGGICDPTGGASQGAQAHRRWRASATPFRSTIGNLCGVPAPTGGAWDL